MQEGLDVMDGMEGIQQSMAMAGWVGWMWFVWSDLRDLCDLCCDELVICVVSLGTGRVPHPGSARKPQPSLLQVLVGTPKLLLDQEEIFFERIGQGRTSVTNNIVESFPQSENVQVGHPPRLPCVEGLKKVSRGWTIRRSRRTPLCVVLCRFLIVLIKS